MEWCEWINVTFNNLVIPWNGVNGLTSHLTILLFHAISHEKEKEDRIVNNKSTNLHGITRLLNVTLIHSHHSME
jgi:hypothetical protein